MFSVAKLVINQTQKTKAQSVYVVPIDSCALFLVRMQTACGQAQCWDVGDTSMCSLYDCS